MKFRPYLQFDLFAGWPSDYTAVSYQILFFNHVLFIIFILLKHMVGFMQGIA